MALLNTAHSHTPANPSISSGAGARAKDVIQRKMDRFVLLGQSAGVSVSAYRQRDGARFDVSNGNLSGRKPYFGMELTYPFVIAILLQMVDEGKVALDTPFVTYLRGQKVCDELHVMDGVDYTDQITLHHLMSHSTGFTDKFMFAPGKDKKSIVHEFLQGVDSKWSFDDVVMRARSHGALYAPGSEQKTSFSDVHFHILGKIIEDIDGKSFAQSVRDRLAKPLGLGATYVYCDPSDQCPAALLTKNGVISVPLIMSSFQSESGIVTTSQESLVFLRAFFEGYLFNRNHLKGICDWAMVTPTFGYGLGMMTVQTSRYATLLSRMDEPWTVMRPHARMVGHWGKNGSFMFWAPNKKIYVAGTVNKLDHMSLAVDLATRLIAAVDRDEIAPTDPCDRPNADATMVQVNPNIPQNFNDPTQKASLGVFE